jgi:integrase
MARHPEPWHWKARDGWYATIRGTRHRLASTAQGKRAAGRRLNEILEAKGQPASAAEVPTVGELCQLYIAHLRHRRDSGELEAGSRKDAIRRLADFPETCGHLPATEIRPHHVTEWLEARRYVPPHRTVARKPKRPRPGKPRATDPKLEPVPPPPAPEPRPLSATSRNDSATAIRAVFRWAVDEGHIDRDPLAGLKKPKRARRRELVLDSSQWPAVLAAITTPEFRDLAEFLRATGARPGEAFRLEARHVDLAKGVAVLNAEEHKTGRKTGGRRQVYFSGRFRPMLERLIREHPAGPIFRNSRGRAWNRGSVNDQVKRIRGRAGVGREFIAYALRHLFATDALDRGIPIATVALMLGHADARMVSTVYSRLDERHEHLRDAIEKVSGD